MIKTKSHAHAGAVLLSTLLATAAASGDGHKKSHEASLHLEVPAEREECSLQHLKGDLAVLAPNAIVAFAARYDKHQLHLLVASFEKHVKDAMLYLFADGPPADWPHHYQRTHFVKCAVGGPSQGEMRMDFYRQKVYLCFLQAAPAIIRVLTVDSRDTVFQASPFQAYTDELMHFFTETSLMPIDQDPYTRSWVLSCTSKVKLTESRENLLGMPIINCGTMMGLNTADSLQRILTLMNEMYEQTSPECIADQGLINALVWGGHYELPRFKIDSTETGRLLTMGHPLAHNSTYVINEEEQLVSKSTGKLYVAVHQYDRVPEVTAMFHRLYSGEHKQHLDGMESFER